MPKWVYVSMLRRANVVDWKRKRTRGYKEPVDGKKKIGSGKSCFGEKSEKRNCLLWSSADALRFIVRLCVPRSVCVANVFTQSLHFYASFLFASCSASHFCSLLSLARTGWLLEEFYTFDLMENSCKIHLILEFQDKRQFYSPIKKK